jgi:hypothetical protein
MHWVGRVILNPDKSKGNVPKDEHEGGRGHADG